MKALPFTGQHCSHLRDQLYFHLELHGLRLRDLGKSPSTPGPSVSSPSPTCQQAAWPAFPNTSLHMIERGSWDQVPAFGGARKQ